MLTIRRATLDDLDLLMAWRMEVLHHVFEVPAGEEMPGLYEANLAYYRAEIPSEGHVAVFAELDGEVVGCGGLCLYREMPSPDNASGRCAYLMNIYTREPYRGQGVGKAVVQWLVDEARRRDVPKVYLETTEGARPLYEELGFHDMVDYLKLQGDAE